jgi:hypothetical protein
MRCPPRYPDLVSAISCRSNLSKRFGAGEIRSDHPASRVGLEDTAECSIHVTKVRDSNTNVNCKTCSPRRGAGRESRYCSAGVSHLATMRLSGGLCG